MIGINRHYKKVQDFFNTVRLHVSAFVGSKLRLKLNFRTWLFIVLSIFLSGLGIAYLYSQYQKPVSANWADGQFGYRQRLPITYSGSENLSEYQVLVDGLDTSALISAGKMQSDCDDMRFYSESGTNLDYFIVATTCNTSDTNVWVKTDRINAGDINIYMYYGNSSVSGESDIEETFSYSEEKDVGYILHGAVTTLDVMSLSDNNSITHNGTTVNLNVGETASNPFTESQFAVVSAKGLFNADDNADDTDSLVPISWAGTEFLFYSRDTTVVVQAIAPWGNATVSVYSAGTVMTGCSGVTVSTSGSTLSCTGGTDPSVIRVTSTVPIVAMSYTNTTEDPKPLKPVTDKDWLGGGTTTVILSGTASTDWRYISSVDASATNPSDLAANSLDTASLTFDASYGQGGALFWSNTSNISFTPAQYGDSDGTDGHTFMDVTEQGTIVGSPHQSDYIAVVSTSAASCSVYNTSSSTPIGTSTLTSSNSSVYTAGFGTGNSSTYTSGAWYMICDAPVAAHFQDAADTEENLWHHPMMRQYTYPSPAVGSFATEEVSPGVAGFWKFDEGGGSSTNDSSGFGNTGTFGSGNSAPTWISKDQCISDSCLYFDGTNDYVSISDSASLDAADAFTVSVWAKPIKYSGNSQPQGFMINKGVYPTYNYRLLTDSNSGNRFETAAYINGSFNSLTSANTYETNKWYFITSTYDGSSFNLYVNGVLDTSTSASGSVGTNATSLYLGRYTNGTGYEYQGFLDDVQIYTYARTAAQIKADYIQGASGAGSGAVLGSSSDSYLSDGLIGYWKMDETSGNGCVVGSADNCDSSGNQKDGTWNGTVSVVTGKFGNAIQTNGSDSNYMSSEQYSGAGPTALTLSFWINTATSSGIPVDLGDIFFCRIGGVTSNKLNCSADGSSSGSTVSTSDINDSSWHHVVYTSQGSTQYLYIDGKLEATGNETHGSTLNDRIRVGRSLSAGAPYSGTIDELRLYQRVFSAREVTRLYEWAPGPLAYWNMNEAVGTTVVYDTSGNDLTLTMNGSMSGSSWTPGKYGQGLAFDGTGDYVSRSNDSTFDFGTGSFSISGWFKTGSNAFGDSSYSQRIATGTDDAEEYLHNNEIDIASSDLELVDEDFEGEQQVGLRFTNVAITRGSRLASADVQFQVDETDTVTTDLVITGEDIDDAPGFTTTTGDITNRTKTTASVAWSVPSWPTVNAEGADQKTPDIASIIEEIISRPGWTSGNDIVIMFNGDGQRIAESYDGESTAAALLSIVPETNQPQYIVSRYDDTGYKVWVDSSGLLNFGIDDDSTWDPDDVASSTAAVTNDVWHHFTAQKDSDAGAIYLYLDGVLVGSDTSLSATGTLTSASAVLALGSDEPVNRSYFAGDLDEIKIHNYALTQKEIVKDMNASHPSVGSPIASPAVHFKLDEGYGTTTNNSGNLGSSLNGTITNALWTNSGKYGKALSYDGVGDYVSIASSTYFDFGTDDFTLSIWINPTAIGSDEPILDLRPGNTAHSLMYIRTNGTIRYQDRPAAGSITTIITSTGTVSAGTWTQVVMTRSSGVWSIYLNGVLSGTSTTSLDLDAGGSPRIGQYQDSDTNLAFEGTLDEFKAYSYALTADEVKADYNKASSVLLGSQSTGLGGTEPSNASNREYCIPGDATSCSSPIAEWKFDANTGSSAYDTSGSGYTGSLGSGNSSPSWTTGIAGQSLDFDGNDYVQATGLLGSPSSFTLSAWVKLDSGADGGEVVSLGDNAAIRVTSSAIWGIYYYDPSWRIITYSTSLAGGGWNYVAYTNDDSGDSQKLYLNGIQVSSGTNTESPVYTLGSNTRIGTHGNGGSTVYNFEGLIDNVRVYNYARSQGQIAWEYNKGAPVAQYKFDECEGSTIYNSARTYNDSAAGYNGTITLGGTGVTSAGTCSTSGAWANGATGRRGASLSFDGTSDYVSISDASSSPLDFTTQMSMMTWLKLDAIDSAYHIFIEKGEPDEYEFYLHPSNVLVAEIGNSQCFSNTTLSAGTWYHAATTWDGSTVNIYLNGQLNGSCARSYTMTPDNSNLTIGYNPDTSDDYWDGQIDDMRLYNYALTAAQIKTVYNNGAVTFE